MPYTPSCSCRPGRQTQNSVTLSTLKVQARMMVKVSDQQNTSSPVLIGHCVTLLSDPAHAKAETWGGTFPHRLLPSLHPENPAEPAKPIALQATLPGRLAPKLVCEPNTFPISKGRSLRPHTLHSAGDTGSLTVQATYRTISTCLHFHLQRYL